MKPAVVDTSILIDHLRGEVSATDLMSRALEREQRLLAATVTRVEVLTGMRAPEKRATFALLDILSWVPLTEELATLAGGLARRYARSHRGVEVQDFVIAATAQHLDAELWTRNVKHFPMFRGLRAP